MRGIVKIAAALAALMALGLVAVVIAADRYQPPQREIILEIPDTFPRS